MPPMPPTDAHLEAKFRNIRPLSLQACGLLLEEHRNCDICNSEYSDDPTMPEYPVRVHPDRGPTTCHHMFCRRCIETLFRTNFPYSARCPICRAQWFNDRSEAEDGATSSIDDISPEDQVSIERLVEAARAGQRQIREIIAEANNVHNGNDGRWIRLTPEHFTRTEPQVQALHHDSRSHPGSAMRPLTGLAPEQIIREPIRSPPEFRESVRDAALQYVRGANDENAGHETTDIDVEAPTLMARGRMQRSAVLLESIVSTRNIQEDSIEVVDPVGSVERAIDKLWGMLN
ncbi:hypothetical protein P280DRAFT_541200 [Massarina eburnea CBS 473.64]|uniref:RING-type domain-containing protein n=1 Tax=Massarina eburnea CBS 473.64 TaxID=1395130 RepID=A0A6A6S6G1_9PLEO|nr:hypothetical protein P280DRAFT_541200 [Massarina eburnea CBS 473.64]